MSVAPLVALPGGRAPQKESPNRQSELSALDLFLIRISGADLTLLSRPECSHERPKFIACGWLLVLAGTLAGISAAFALHRVFHVLLTALVFGAFWGFYSFTIDKLLVVSMRKKKGFLLHTILLAIPRLLLAGMLAITVSKPLEMAIFGDEISFQLTADANRDRLSHTREATESFPEITRLETEKASLQQQIDDARRNRDEAYKAAMDEAAGLDGADKGLGPLYKAKQAFLATRTEELDGLLSRNRARIQEINRSLESLRAARDNAVEMVQTAQDKSNGILASLHALDEIAADPKAGQTLLMAILFVNGIFWTLDVMPVLTKLITPYGVYDALVESRERAAMAHYGNGSAKVPDGTFAHILTQRLEDETAHIARLEKQLLEFEEKLFARALGKLNGTDELNQREDEIGVDILSRLRSRLDQLTV